jgi:hypothetical protein
LRFGTVSLRRIVSEKFFNEINMCHDHSATAIALAAKLIHSISIRNTLVKKLKISLPKVANNLSAREASNWDDHRGKCGSNSAKYVMRLVSVKAAR